MGSRAVTPKQFYVYTHARPDGSVFYVGKGHGRRATDFSPSRRSKHHRNLAMKHGLRNIIVRKFPCESEDAAFALEIEMIAEFTICGVALINRTTGGEGASGRPMSEKTMEALKKGRGKGAFFLMSEESKANVLAGLARGRALARSRPMSQKEHERRSAGAKRASAARLAKASFPKICQHCGKSFNAKRPGALYCHKRCGVRAWRARDIALNGKPAPKPLGPRSPEGRAKVGAAQKAKYEAMTPEERFAKMEKLREGARNRKAERARDQCGDAGGVQLPLGL